MKEFIAGWMLGIILGTAVAAFMQRRNDEDQAVKAGVAEYYLDDHHSKQFRWITNSGNIERPDNL